MFSLMKRKTNLLINETPFSCQRDDLTIRGTLLRMEGENQPAAIVCHGFMANQDTVRQYALPLAEMGYAVYIFDFCGGCVSMGESDGDTTDMSVLTEVRDLEAVLNYVKAQPHVDASRILLAGCSQGGFVSALTAAKHPDEINRLVLIYPALCIPDDARSGQMMFARFDPANLPEVIPCGPMKLGRCYPADVLEMDPFEEIKPYRGSVLLIHGTKDTLVRPEYSQRALEAYRASCPEGMSETERAQLLLIEDGAHGFSETHDIEAISAIRAYAAV